MRLNYYFPLCTFLFYFCLFFFLCRSAIFIFLFSTFSSVHYFYFLFICLFVWLRVKCFTLAWCFVMLVFRIVCPFYFFACFRFILAVFASVFISMFIFFFYWNKNSALKKLKRKYIFNFVSWLFFRHFGWIKAQNEKRSVKKSKTVINHK